MSIDPADNDLIEQYLLGKLTDAGIRKFEARLGDDREFARKFRLITTFPEMMSAGGYHEYEKLRAKEVQPLEKKKSARVPGRVYIAGAAVLLILITAVGIFFIFMGSNHNKESVGQEKVAMARVNVVNTPVVPARDSAVSVKKPETKEKPVTAAGNLQKPIELINPAEGAKFSGTETILFNWQQKTDTFTRFYIISALHSQVVYWRGVRPGIREYKVPATYLYPGKYYWYVGVKAEERSFTIGEEK